MLFLTRLLNLININTVGITIHYLIIISAHILAKSIKLAHSTFLAIFLALSEVHDFVTTFRTGVGVSAILERYLVLGDINSATTISSIRLSSGSLTAQLLFIMKARISQSI